MKPAALALTAALAVSITGCDRRDMIPVANSDKVSAQVTADVGAMLAAYKARDAARSASFDAPGYRGLYPGAPDTLGPEADKAEMAGQFKDPANAFALTGEPQITVSAGGGMAFYEQAYAMTRTDAKTGKPATETGSWVGVFRLQPDGSMKLWRSITVPGPKAPAPAAG
jgi:ketosteroid isomerase-like protein